ncbi:helix-turn-helix domain-containing protein [Paenirhodobacter sp.]|uniref:AraC family transcriptional regulator n=1 Tax=Paenirhodobacter sp. TaxID=1965326 RepID=UPI003B3CB3C5
MTLIEPHRFTPRETGNATRVTLPGLHRSTHVDVLRISDGLVLAHSHFSPATRHDAEIRRPGDQVILAINLSGRMRLIEPNGGAHDMSGGQAWMIRCGGNRMQRVVEKGEGCANLVIAGTLSRMGPRLAGLCHRALPRHAPFRRLRLPMPGGAVLDTLRDGRTDPAALLRKEGQCLALLGHAFEELAADGPADPALLTGRLSALLSERLAGPITMAEIEQAAGLSHVTLNRIFRAETGMTIFARLREMRIEAAERMIRHTDRSITEIAAECGFADASHLSRVFRKRYGTTAGAWRRRGNP